MDHQAQAETAYHTVLQTFYLPDVGLCREHSPAQPADRRYAYLWPYLGLVSATNAMLGLVDTERPYLPLLQRVLSGLEQYWRAPGYESYVIADGGGQRFYDDNAWAGLELLNAYGILRDRHLLDRTQEVFDFVVSGWTPELGGGLYWREGDNETKNTCSNGPACVLALKLYQATGDKHYLDWARRLYQWTNARLRAPEGVYWDNVDRQGRINRDTYTYNTGIMIHAMVLLRQCTGEDAYLQDAIRLAQRSLEHFAPVNGGKRFFPSTPWFNAVLFRSYLALGDAAGDSSFAGVLLASLQYAWENARDERGLVNRDWGSSWLKHDYASLLDQAPVAEIFALAAGLRKGSPSPATSDARRERGMHGFTPADWRPAEGPVILSPLGTVGSSRRFQNQGTYSSDRYGDFTLSGPIYAYYQEQGGPAGYLGFPLSDAGPALPSPRGVRGTVQYFEGSQEYPAAVAARLQNLRCGAAVYSTEAYGAHATWYDLGACYESFGGSGGVLGYPTSDRSPAAPSPRGTAGYLQRFEGGSIYSCALAGAHPVYDAISACYEALGGTGSRLGFPISDVTTDTRSAAPRGTLRQRFEGGWIYWQPDSEAQPAYD